MKRLLLSLFLTFCALAANAMTVFSRQFNTANGLPNNNIRSLAQDAKGFIWMGSSNGLYRFDGYFFTTYRYAETGNLRLLNNNHINSCYALPDGKMLFREQGNLFSVYDTEQESFVDMPTGQKEAIYQQMRRREAPQHLLAPYQGILARGGNFINDNLGNVIVLDQTGQIWFIDRQHVDKMVYNLLSNAFKYTPQKGSVTVRVKVGDLLQIIIEDTGVGIPREKQPELFQLFMQSVFSSDSIGIGLHLTKALVDVHHGQISFAENRPQGSVFTISLPVDERVYRPEDFLQASRLERPSVVR